MLKMLKFYMRVIHRVHLLPIHHPVSAALNSYQIFTCGFEGVWTLRPCVHWYVKPAARFSFTQPAHADNKCSIRFQILYVSEWAGCSENTLLSWAWDETIVLDSYSIFQNRCTVKEKHKQSLVHPVNIKHTCIIL